MKQRSFDFDAAFRGEDVRKMETANPRRELKICDEKGLSWLVDLKRNAVLWLNVQLGSLRYRPSSTSDPSGCFEGSFRFGEYTVRGPFSLETAEIIRKVVIPGISLLLVPDAASVRAIGVSFVENERVPETG